jgi:hypothetical protein
MSKGASNLSSWPPAPIEFRSALFAVVGANGRPVGIAFAIDDDGLLATCAHVVRGSPGDKVAVRWLADPGVDLETTILELGYSSEDDDDRAILRLQRLPLQVASLPLLNRVDSGVRFDAVGVVDLYAFDSICAVGETVGEAAKNRRPMLQLRSREVTSGFSGTPVWIPSLQGVAGMISEVTRPDELSKLSDTVFALPATRLAPFVANSHRPVQRHDAPYDRDWYVVRASQELQVRRSLLLPGQPAILYGPRCFGKSWLLSHILRQIGAFGPDATIVSIDFRPFASLDEKTFYQELTKAIRTAARSSTPPPTPRSATYHSFEQTLGALLERNPVVLGIENADLLVGLPFAGGFYARLRELATRDWGNWAKFRLMVAVSTLPELLNMRCHPSPFNLTVAIELDAFSPAQVGELVNRHHLRWTANDTSELYEQLGGHPYLTRMCLYAAAEKRAQRASDAPGMARLDLRRFVTAEVQRLRPSESLRQALREWGRTEGFLGDLVHQDLVQKTGYFVEDSEHPNTFRLRGKLLGELRDQLMRVC